MNLSINKVINDSNIDIPNNIAGYNFCYPEFIKYFNEKSEVTMHSFIIGVNFAYAWMPKILNLKTSNIKNVISAINSVRLGKELTFENFEEITECINRSVVGTSKLLHFIYPEEYPIWDSHVCRYLNSQKNNCCKINSIHDYISYKRLALTLSRSEEYNEVHNRIQDKVSYSISKVRSLELIFFINGRNLLPEHRNSLAQY